MAVATIALHGSSLQCPARPSSTPRFPSSYALRLAMRPLRACRYPLFASSSARLDAAVAAFHSKHFVSAASLDDSASVDTEVKDIRVEEIREEVEKQAEDSKKLYEQVIDDLKDEELKQQAEDSKESFYRTVDNLKDEAVKAAEVLKNSGGESAEKLVGVLRDTTEQLKEQAEKARAALAATAQETAERSKENLSYIAESAPDPIKDIAETALKAHSSDKLRKGSKIHDFCLGIPYGGFLVIGGLLWFIISGSTAAIRFGVILGGILLGLSVSSLNAWKEGKSSMPYIKGQAAITSIIMLREVRRFFEVKAFFPTAVAAVMSAGMLGFYSYVYLSGGNPPKKTKQAPAN